MRKEYVKNIKNPSVVKVVEEAAMFVSTGKWAVATEAEYKAAQSGGKKPKGEM